MKTQISSIDLHFLLKEMQDLIGARVDKIYNPSKEEILIQLHLTGEGKKIIRIISGKFMFITEQKEPSESPSGFCMFLRKYLENTRLREISQVSSERIAKLSFEAKESNFNMYVELFGKGNIILTDEKEVIISALELQKWADREINKGIKYSYPKKDFNFFVIKKDEMKKILNKESEIVLCLAKDFGLGGTYAEEILLRAGIDKKKKKLSDEESEKVFSEFKKIINNDLQAAIIYDDVKLKDIIPFELDIYNDFEKKEFPSFNSAFDFFYKNEFGKREFKSKHQTQIDKTNEIIDKQRKQIASLEKKAEEESRKGEIIYENYQMIDNIITELNKARQKYSFDEIREKLKGNKKVKSIDGKDKKVTIEV
jgi:predicted ribosome quality control (RQC) complex YloA/Tae2 family protein